MVNLLVRSGIRNGCLLQWVEGGSTQTGIDTGVDRSGCLRAVAVNDTDRNRSAYPGRRINLTGGQDT
jgi:hypothetical protein